VTRPSRIAALLAGIGLLGAAAVVAPPFDHWQHRTLFVSCNTCHAGVEAPSRPLWPTQADCASCHDDRVEKRVAWTAPLGPPPGNLRFEHPTHAQAMRSAGRDTAAGCADCHASASAEWMRVQRAVVANCLECHGVRTDHFDAPDSACAQCHVPFWDAPSLPEARVAGWGAPASHKDQAFIEKHGELATPDAGPGVAASCATCHARDFCMNCHVNAPEEPAIQALHGDPRSLALAANDLKAPASHQAGGFLQTHGGTAAAPGARCAVGHTQESCTTCHIVGPTEANLVPAAGPGRGAGARLVRARPASHGRDFIDAHGAPANAAPATCAGCHVREQCIDCHRPNAAAQAGYHPADYLARHPVAAYGREVSCADCHNTGQFCQSCHAQAGLRSSGTLGTRGTFHDAGKTFVVGHGQAARQSLESCVSCHSERDCLTCHSAVGGRRFNPHGPGWDAERMQKQNPQMCTACHGTTIPGT
jgi:hypothetical protein